MSKLDPKGNKPVIILSWGKMPSLSSIGVHLHSPLLPSTLQNNQILPEALHLVSHASPPSPKAKLDHTLTAHS